MEGFCSNIRDVDDIVRICRYKGFETAKFLLLHQDSNRDERESLEISIEIQIRFYFKV